jgi:hypothetical protein
MTLAVGHETHALSWTTQRPGAQVARAALSYMWNQGENGICCLIGMTYSRYPGFASRSRALGRVGQARHLVHRLGGTDWEPSFAQ